MKMKKLFLSGAFAVMTMVGICQTSQPHPKVTQSYTVAEIAEMPSTRLDYLNFYADNACVVHIPGKSIEGLPLLSTYLKHNAPNLDVNTLTPENFNPFNYTFQPLPETSQLFVIDGTNNVVQLHSQATIDRYYGMHIVNQRKLNKNR
jgi:hypothetical protein